MRAFWIAGLGCVLATSAIAARPSASMDIASPSLNLRARSSSTAAELSVARRYAQTLSQDVDPESDILLFEERPPARKPGVAFLLSALLPGAGQLYNGNRRGYLFLGVEAASWFARLSYLDASDRKEEDYQAFANRHWSYPRFHDTAGEDGCLWTGEADSLIQVIQGEDETEYYEEIASSDTYRCGWDDFSEHYDPTDPDRLSPRRAEFREQREKANQLQDRANLAVAALVLNRIVSAVDAFRVARSRQPEASDFRLESRLTGSMVNPRLDLTITRTIP
jgi:hypothetical protein